MFAWPLLLAVAVPLAAPKDLPVSETWPQWRGPTGDSVAPQSDLPIKWSKAESVVWKTAVPGWGTSTPAIWGDAIFLTTQDEERLLFMRLDRKSGRVVFEKECSRGVPRRKNPLGNGRFHDEHNMASPSPVTDGEHVWVHFGNGFLACYDFDGKSLWSTDLIERFGPYTIWWGHANSPIVVGDLLISACMQDPKGGGKSYVVAHDKRTGKERWFVERDTGATSEPADAYTTPILHRRDGKTEIIVMGGNVLDAYEPETGKQIWQARPFKGNRVISGPTLVRDTVFAIEGMKGPVYAVKTGGSGDVTATHVQWKYAGAQTPDAASPVSVKGLVFLATNSGAAICLDAQSGKELWKENRLSKGFRSTPLVAGDRIYFFGTDGKATIVEAAPAYRVVGEGELGEEMIASPAVAGNDLYLRTKKHLYRIGSGR